MPKLDNRVLDQFKHEKDVTLPNSRQIQNRKCEKLLNKTHKYLFYFFLIFETGQSLRFGFLSKNKGQVVI